MFRHLFDYHFHLTFRALDMAAVLESEAYLGNPGYGHGSIHALLLHLRQTDWAWREALETGQQQPPLTASDYPDLPSLRAGFQAEQAAWNDLLEKLSNEEIASTVSLHTRRGNAVDFPRWRILQHVILHGMQHHSELAHRLTGLGQQPGNIDYIFYD